MPGRSLLRSALLVSLLALPAAGACRAPSSGAGRAAPVTSDPLSPARLAPVRAYIARGWRVLERSLEQLPEAARDPKFPLPQDARLPVYHAPSEDPAALAATIDARLPPARRALVDLRALPVDHPERTTPPGLLFLPEPYVVPGGRFNEMYGWDSHFIVLGLLRDGEVARARAQTDNFLYEVERYGKVLNANRTYYLTRSQPPLLSSMVRAVFAATDDLTWLRRARAALEATHRFWTRPPHLAGATGLSRYYDTGEGPAPEVVASERDEAGRTHYDRVRAFYRNHAAKIDAYAVADHYDRAADRLKARFYVGDRSMRESGFDPSDRWGPFGVGVVDYAPVCLNVLLVTLEEDLALIAAALGDEEAADTHRAQAGARRRAIDQHLWDERTGLYLDYDFVHGRRRLYPFATTFWPLAAGVASPAQAARVRANLPLFERAGGVRTSDRATGNQWDAPFGWAPLQLFAVQGLRRYGYGDDAARVARAFLSLVVEDFERRGAIVEKYDVERRTSDVERAIRFGYAENVIGFGWTNGVFLELLATELPDRFSASAPVRRP